MGKATLFSEMLQGSNLRLRNSKDLCAFLNNVLLFSVYNLPSLFLACKCSNNEIYYCKKRKLPTNESVIKTEQCINYKVSSTQPVPKTYCDIWGCPPTAIVYLPHSPHLSTGRCK